MRSFLLAATLLACHGSGDEPTPPSGAPALRVRPVVSGLESPLFLTAPAGDARLFVVEQPGRIRVVENGQLRAAPFLDITAKVASGGERGLLGLAFHPRYAQNGWFYVDYTDRDGDTRVERYRVSADRNVADPASATLVLAVDQPYANHNGGQVSFGPDGRLYVALGDGGSGGDPQGNGQSLGTLLGKLLRLDVDGGTPYAIPSDNPFVGRPGARGEIWAYGLRNPWRFAFDGPAGRLYIADVGQGAREEIDVAPIATGGLNYGWNRMEGTRCYRAESCDRTGLTAPVFDYGHDDGACSIVGGYVYRGDDAALAPLVGHYFYSDYCAGWLRSLRVAADGTVTDVREWDVGPLGQVLSFGVDAAGRLYVLSANGTVYAVDGAA
ncbi:MAG TPA: PQQ-dependent sugar dehydrogenase [Gemmatimonadaceae bacterium]|nr:PQQ-dependent sugar dehydrogenase [Gemmatimonadaceae bacterium]